MGVGAETVHSDKWTPERSPRAPTPCRLLVVLVLVALAATGCFDADAAVVVKSDGSGVVTFEVIPDPDLAVVLDQVDIETIAQDVLAGVEGATFRAEERMGLERYFVEVPFDDYRDLTVNILEGATIAGQTFTPFTQFDLRELDEGGWRLTAVTNPLGAMASFQEGTALGLAGAAARARTGTDPRVKLSVSLPGAVIASNAESTDKGTAVWELSDPSKPYTLDMTTEAVSAFTTLQLVLAGVAGVIVLGLVLTLVGSVGPARRDRGSRSRRRRERKRSRGGNGVAGTTGWEPPSANQDLPQPKGRGREQAPQVVVHDDFKTVLPAMGDSPVDPTGIQPPEGPSTPDRDTDRGDP
ncbi:MAG: hypothetical protein ACK5O2_16785 [Microthrixaceae bacterium]